MWWTKLTEIIVTLIIFGRVNAEFQINTTHVKYNEYINIIVHSTEEFLLRFDDSHSICPYVVYVWCKSEIVDKPVFIVVRQQEQVTSWELPLPVSTSNSGVLKFPTTSRTLCHNNMDIIARMPRNETYKECSEQENKEVFLKQLSMSVSTASAIPIEVIIKVEEQNNFFVKENQDYDITISPSEPRYFYYKFLDENHKDYTSTVILEVSSEDYVCFDVSIQEPSCNVADLDVRYSGKHQTVNLKGGIIIKKREYPHGFFVVFVAKGDNFACSRESSVIPQPRAEIIVPMNRTSQISFNIKPSITKEDYILASLTTLGIILLFYLIFALTTWAFYRWDYKLQRQEEIELQTRENGMMDGTDPNFMRMPDDIDTVLRSSSLTLSQLAKKSANHFEKKSYAYMWHVLSIAIFYGIPVVQLVVTYQRVVNVSGNQDICYYNFLCAHPLFGASDFNHVYSNIGYILMGILFGIIIFYKQHFVAHKAGCGIPKHYGLFYAMAVALIMEGILSACYHICPSQSNFQFDTSFMYVMAILCMIKLYQNRHPDINATAYATFVVLGFAIFAAMIGVLSGHIALWILFIIAYLILCLYVSFKIYFLSYVEKGVQAVRQEWHKNHNVLKTMEPKRKVHFILLLVVILFNIIFANLGILCYFKGTDFATFLLGLLMGNAILYAIIYIIMKIAHREKLCIQAILFGILGLTSWIAGTYFFVNNSTMWNVTPAESRQFNRHCVIMDFYDFHDIWHLLSAPALFFTFMLLLSLDDDLVNTPHSEIVVF